MGIVVVVVVVDTECAQATKREQLRVALYYKHRERFDANDTHVHTVERKRTCPPEVDICDVSYRNQPFIHSRKPPSHSFIQ